MNDSESANHPQIWWSNSIFFVAVHLAALAGIYWIPLTLVSWKTIALTYAMWQLAEFGITIGYHRLWSHRAFRATAGVRLILAVLGSAGFQGSIKWWCLRHRLHHRFTDDPVHDPYAATRGLLYSHMGWIFFKPTYTRMELVDREDLDRDPVVRFQHKYYIPLALFFGFAVPPLIGALWHDALGAFVWAGLVSRVAVWHCTFFVNSLAHWDGLQPFSDEDTSRGNFLLAVMTSGEGNHNFHHAFPHDYRSGPWLATWDPSKWVIFVLYKLGFVTGLRQAREVDLKEAMAYMNHKHVHGVPPTDDDEEHNIQSEGKLQTWTLEETKLYLKEHPHRCLVLLRGWVVDVTTYLGEHPGGASLLRKYAVSLKDEDSEGDQQNHRDASWAFDGGLNNHSRAAVKRMKELRLAKIETQPVVVS